MTASLVPTYCILSDTVIIAGTTVTAGQAIGFDDLPITTLGAPTKGIARNDTVMNDEAVTVEMEGIVPAIAAGPLAKGIDVTADANGKMVAAGAGHYIFGRTKAANTSADDQIAIYVTREGIKA